MEVDLSVDEEHRLRIAQVTTTRSGRFRKLSQIELYLPHHHRVFSRLRSSAYRSSYHLLSTTLTTKTPKVRQKWYAAYSVYLYEILTGSAQPLAIDLLNPSAEHERKQHKLKRLVQSPNSYFMDVKCPGASRCFAITTVFSHAQSVVLCGSCASVLCQPTGGKARLTEGSSFRRKN
ncbi:hypothetical protein BDR05DRAFT_921899 [Suillus weaverae]|nr:hypothetical protein BDR05DRAFT_921899 [Suillus weaverae]